jgi:RNA exonuclease 1
VLSIDCEMCETTDPVTGEKVGDTLIRFSVTDGMLGGAVLLDSLVQPGLPVSDLRTNIHGITEEQLSKATWTLRHAQAALLNLCTDRTIIIGHSLHKDLKSLHFTHTCVVDTAFLYTLDKEPGSAPSLRDVSDQVLFMKLPEPHDSVQDAQAALFVASVLLTAGPQAPIVRSNGNGGNGETPTHPSLLIHRIPDYCSEQNIHDMIASYTQVMPLKVSPIARGQSAANGSSGPSIPSGKASVFFRTAMHCDLAFESIAGPNRPDKQNRDQKRVYFKGGGYVCVRK